MELKEKAKPMGQSKFDAITKAIAKLIAMNDRPTNIATDEGLQDIVRNAAILPRIWCRSSSVKSTQNCWHFRHSPENDVELQTEQINQKSESLMQEI